MGRVAIFVKTDLEDYRMIRLKEEIKNYNNISIIDIEKDNIFPYNEKILNYDVYYFFVGSNFLSDIHFLAKYLEKNGKKVINSIHTKESVISKTLFYSILNKYVKIPEFVKIYSIDNIEYVINKIGFPMVIKHQFAHRGEFVHKIDNEKELYNFLEKYLLEKKINLKNLIFQKYIPYEKDIRVIFVGKPIGAMERINKNSFKANISQGGYGRPYELNEEIIDIGYKIMEKCDLQIFGFDLLLKDNQYYLIDLHHIFQYEGFDKYLNRNVTREILNYLNEISNKS
jgi:RimK family alpha-L-glutamate ligase